MIESTPIFDEIHQFMGRATRNLTKAMQEATRNIDAFSWHATQLSKDMTAWNKLEAENQKRKARLKKQREKCLRGRRFFLIKYKEGVLDE